jgi:hypothetical protein
VTRSRLVRGALVLLPLLAVPIVTATPSRAAGGDLRALDVSRQLTRSHLNADGTTAVADHRTVTLHVSQTTSLHSRQPIRVSWTGAHPTGGIVADASASVARLQEYPFVLMECRGVDSAAAPTGKRLSPQTCWTQSVQERFQRDNTTGFPAWRVDRAAVPAQRTAVVGAPAPRPVPCGSPSPAEHWLPFVSVSGQSYNTNLSLCGTQAPEASNVGGAGQPSNTTYAITQKDGSGSTKFTTWTQEDNASLGCSDSVPCALVAVPIIGISCDESAKALPAADRPSSAAAADVQKGCRSTGNYAAGAPNQNGAGNAEAVSGSLWWSASNWNNRIVVPLGFAPLSNACDLAGAKRGIDVYGSELLTQLTTQWRPRFCLGASVTPFKHVQVGEPQAASLLTNGTIAAAFVSNPPASGWNHPVINAPTAISGFSISYAIDDVAGAEYDRLKLTPRLLAKLITQSYPALSPIKAEYKALSANPLNITLDPEFQALNPSVPKGVGASAAASELFSLSSDSDVIAALTGYLNADPEARAFLDGAADPWGMVVNPSYKGITLPVSAWPQRDTFEPKSYYSSGQNECLQFGPVPFLPLVSAPTARLANISLALQFALSNSQIDCVAVPGQTDGVGSKLVAQGRQQPGFRFLLGITSLGDAQRYALSSAGLQSSKAATATARFTTDAGRSFVAPTDAALVAAATLLKPDAASKSWKLSYPALAANAAAYPGTMPVFTAVSTAGVSAADAKGYAAFLRYAAGDGQVRGLGNGQLPPGFLPLTNANGLGAMAAYTRLSAGAVEAQSGAVPALSDTVLPATSAAGATKAAGSLPGGQASRSNSPAVLPITGAPATVTTDAPALPTPALALPVPHLTPEPVALAVGITPGSPSAVAGLLLPVLLGVAVGGGLLALGGDRWSRRQVTS